MEEEKLEEDGRERKMRIVIVLSVLVIMAGVVVIVILGLFGPYLIVREKLENNEPEVMEKEEPQGVLDIDIEGNTSPAQ